ncbi:MAG: zinc ribbon domain-containing protein [Gemmataceae bacterium]|nr:zinc ribbon domain-containing protein [Gemmataceae bacterium]
MPVRRHDHDDLDPREDPEDPEGPEADDEGLMPCPHCFAVIHDDSEQCPRCGQYLSREDAPSNKPRWIVVTAVIVLAIAIAQAAFLWP